MIIIKTFICQRCGEEFTSKGNRALYCPRCRKLRQRERSSEYQWKKEDGVPIRKIGDTDICVNCGKPYVIKSGSQKVCDDCRKDYTVQKKVKANNDYKNKTYDTCSFYVKKGEKIKLKEYAKNHNISFNELVNTALNEYFKKNK